jgi:uncharacterized membrane protein HdeD (DUF308 family)
MYEVKDRVKSVRNRMKILGAIAIVLGILALLTPVLTGFSIVILLGVLVLIAGIDRIIWAFQADSLGRGLLMFAIGGLTLLCGIALIANPLFVSGVLSLLLIAYFILDGIFELTAGLRLRPEEGWGWLLAGGIVSVLLGIMIWAQFPLSGVWAMGVLLGIKMIFIGLIMVMATSAVRTMARPV